MRLVEQHYTKFFSRVKKKTSGSFSSKILAKNVEKEKK